MALWNPWHGCTKISPGCVNCYMYARDAEFGKDSSVVTKTASFNLPVKRTRQGAYKLQPDGDPGLHDLRLLSPGRRPMANRSMVYDAHPGRPVVLYHHETAGAVL